MCRGSSACTRRTAPMRATSRRASARSRLPTCSNSATPDGTRKHLKPGAPSSFIAASSPALPGTAPPQNPTSTKERPFAAGILAFIASADVVGGTLFRGMSKMVVTPPAAAARVADSNPSHSVRPCSFTWTCVSTRPGRRTESPSSTTSPRPAVAIPSETDAMTPPRTTTVAGPVPPGVTTRRPVRTTSAPLKSVIQLAALESAGGHRGNPPDRNRPLGRVRYHAPLAARFAEVPARPHLLSHHVDSLARDRTADAPRQSARELPRNLRSALADLPPRHVGLRAHLRFRAPELGPEFRNRRPARPGRLFRALLHERDDVLHPGIRRRHAPDPVREVLRGRRVRDWPRVPRDGHQLSPDPFAGVLAPRVEHRAARRPRRVASHGVRAPPAPRRKIGR